MYDTNEHVHVCVSGSKLVQYKVFLAKFCVGEACCGLYKWKFSVSLGYQPAAVVVAVTVLLRRWNKRIYRSWAGVVMSGLIQLDLISAKIVKMCFGESIIVGRRQFEIVQPEDGRRCYV